MLTAFTYGALTVVSSLPAKAETRRVIWTWKTHIFGPDNKEYVPVGINVLFPEHVDDKAISTWAQNGFNAIRISGDSSANTQKHPIVTLDKVENLANKVRAYGITTQLSYRPGKFSTQTGIVLQGDDLKAAQAYWAAAARRFARRDDMMFNTMNEMGDGTNDDAKLVAEKALIQTIRENGFRGPIVVDDNYWGHGSIMWGGKHTSFLAAHGAELAAFDAKLLKSSTGHIVAGLHIYRFTSKAGIVAAIDALRAQELPVIIGEFGNNRFPDVVDTVKQIVQERGNVGALLWSYDWSGMPADKMALIYKDFLSFCHGLKYEPAKFFGSL